MKHLFLLTCALIYFVKNGTSDPSENIYWTDHFVMDQYSYPASRDVVGEAAYLGRFIHVHTGVIRIKQSYRFDYLVDFDLGDNWYGQIMHHLNMHELAWFPVTPQTKRFHMTAPNETLNYFRAAAAEIGGDNVTNDYFLVGRMWFNGQLALGVIYESSVKSPLPELVLYVDDLDVRKPKLFRVGIHSFEVLLESMINAATTTEIPLKATHSGCFIGEIDAEPQICFP